MIFETGSFYPSIFWAVLIDLFSSNITRRWDHENHEVVKMDLVLNRTSRDPMCVHYDFQTLRFPQVSYNSNMSIPPFPVSGRLSQRGTSASDSVSATSSTSSHLPDAASLSR